METHGEAADPNKHNGTTEEISTKHDYHRNKTFNIKDETEQHELNMTHVQRVKTQRDRRTKNEQHKS